MPTLKLDPYQPMAFLVNHDIHDSFKILVYITKESIKLIIPTSQFPDFFFTEVLEIKKS